VHWGIARADLAQPDPAVWQRVNSDPPEWYPENEAFSAFLVSALAPSRGR